MSSDEDFVIYSAVGLIVFLFYNIIYLRLEFTEFTEFTEFNRVYREP